MRIWVVFIFFSGPFWSQAQDTLYELKAKNKTLYAVIQEVSRSYRLKFAYDPEKLRQESITTTISEDNEHEFIETLFANLPFEIKEKNGVYLIIPQKKTKTQRVWLSGWAEDAKTGEPLAYAHVRWEDQGTTTNADGHFTLLHTGSEQPLKVSYVGYETTETVVGKRAQEINIQVKEDPSLLQEVVLTSDQVIELPLAPSIYRLNPKTFNSIPSLGEVDAFKSLQLLPGIRATDETTSGLSVRGNSPEHNLVQLDGFTLYHLDHFFGIFSTFNSSTIGNIDIYKGGFDAQYGGRISSVVDARARNPNFNEVSGGVGINLMSANGYLELPTTKQSSLLVGFRRSFIDIFKTGLFKSFLASNRVDALEALEPSLNDAFDLTPQFYFYDFNAKWKYRLSSNSVVDFNLYLSKDDYEGTFEAEDEQSIFEVTDQAIWSNRGMSFNWKQYLTSKWYSELSIGHSLYRNTATYVNEETFFQPVVDTNTELLLGQDSTVNYLSYDKSNVVDDLSVKILNDFNLTPDFRVTFGAEINQLSTDYRLGYFQEDVEDYENSATITSIFASNRYRLGPFTANAGLRYVYYDLTRERFLEPRLSMNYQLLKNLRLKASWTQHHQFINRMALSPFGNSDQYYWVLADRDVYPILSSTHVIAGAEYTLSRWTLNVEAYDKTSNGVLESEYVVFAPQVNENVNIEDFVYAGENKSTGLDVFLKYKNDRHDAWLSYSLSRSENQFSTLNRGRPYPTLQDQKHEINLVNIVKLGPWEFGAVFIYGSGRPYTPNGGIKESGTVILYDVNRINSLRLPDYHRLDLSAKYTFEMGRYTAQTGLTLFNIYNQQNAKSRRYGVRYNFDENAAEADNLAAQEAFVQILELNTQLLGFTPNFFFNLRF